ncbi:MAG: hypothetical protein HYZ81_26450 [Nitrospinae bacterium]|nr:hypothetical protein [Nitrospinota bacterium]
MSRRTTLPTERKPEDRAAETLLDGTVSVPWERPVHVARLALLTRVAHAGQLSVHVACGTDRLGFIDVAFGLTTILTDIDGASLDILSQQLTDLQDRLGPFPGCVQFRQIAVEALMSREGFPPASIQHLTLQNLFNARVHPVGAYPCIIDTLLAVIADGGTCFITESEAAVLKTRALIHGARLLLLGRSPGYYDEDVFMLRVRKPPGERSA